MILFTAPELISIPSNCQSVFLAGSIEQGLAELWQDRAVHLFSDCEDLCVFNPRRLQWDSTWEQSIANPQFKEQVTWELDALTQSDYVLFYFDPATKSPITLMELGLHKYKAHVICPEGFWRKGNVDIFCERYGIPQYHTLDQAIEEIKNIVRS